MKTTCSISEGMRERQKRYEQSEKGKATKRRYQTESLNGYLKKRRWDLRKLRSEIEEKLNGKDT